MRNLTGYCDNSFRSGRTRRSGRNVAEGFVFEMVLATFPDEARRNHGSNSTKDDDDNDLMRHKSARYASYYIYTNNAPIQKETNTAIVVVSARFLSPHPSLVLVE